jgi:single-stranded-DNA-specific exonuclease
LLSDSVEEATSIASKLEVLNKRRQTITERAITEAKLQLVKGNNSLTPPNLIFAGKQHWAPGILGLIAGRLSEEYNRPVIAASGEGEYIRASARSIPEFNMIEALKICAPVFEKYGGHPMAAGFTIKREHLKTFRQQMSSVADELLENVQRKSILDIDTEIDFSWINRESLGFLQSLEPYGNGNLKPVFLTRGATILDSRGLGRDKNHLKLIIQQNGTTIEAMAFRQGKRIKEARGELDVAYTTGLNYWKGRESIQLTVEDFKKSA